MKKIITIAMLLFSMASYAQGNLQFNQVLTYNGTLTPSQFVSTTYTVPTGKIWKIKYVTHLPYTTTQSIYTNNQPVNYGFALNINSKWQFGENFTEIFLKSGDTIKLGWTNQTAPSGFNAPFANFDYVISIVEFNIVQ
jgi:hypothetical protein